jgi:aryl-phospho-beta-D-glucosidase BglC (GH1 family)
MSSAGGKSTTTNIAGSNAGGTNTGGSGNTGLPQLHVAGNLLKDSNGKTIILRGVSLIDIGELYYGGNQNASGITARIDKVLAAGMHPHVIRLPVYPRTVTNGSSPAYSRVPYPLGPNAPTGRTQVALTPDQYLSSVLQPAVDYVTQKGMYVIIDYHQIDNTDDTTRQSAQDANAFWQFMADKFKDYSNVLYEAYNEPIDMQTTWAAFKPRAQTWIDTIRAVASNVIIVPSMSYCQRPGDAADAPPSGSDLMYTAHVYPGNWNTTFQAQLANAVAKVPVFMTEWGYDLGSKQNPTGTSVTTWGADFRAVVDPTGASWTAWVTDASWAPKMFSDVNLTQLTDFGTLTKAWLSEKVDSDWVE